MNNKFNSLLMIITLPYLGISCQTSSRQVELLDINDNGIAIFKVTNTTNKDYSGIVLELKYLSTEDEVIKVDTVHYSISESATIQIFIEAGGQTTIAQKVPANTIKASGKIISTTY